MAGFWDRLFGKSERAKALDAAGQKNIGQKNVDAMSRPLETNPDDPLVSVERMAGMPDDGHSSGPPDADAVNGPESPEDRS